MTMVKIKTKNQLRIVRILAVAEQVSLFVFAHTLTLNDKYIIAHRFHTCISNASTDLIITLHFIKTIQIQGHTHVNILQM